MENENELGLELDKIEGEAEEKLKVKNRFQKLSEKVIISAKEREEADAKTKAETARADAITKERDFYKDFSSNSAKYPHANQFQDQIFEKVKSGYTTEDAIVTVLNKEGKLGSTIAPISTPNVAGGSSSNITSEKDKSLEGMSRADKLKELLEAEKRGEIGMS